MSWQQAQLTLRLTPTGAAISPLIYGVNNEHDPERLRQLGATMNRLGGTPWSTLNGSLRTTNSGRVAKDTKSDAFSVRKYGQQQHVLEGDAGNGVKPDGSLLSNNDPTDAYIANTPALQEAWLRSLPGSVPLFGLDNEPMLWHHSHRAAHPDLDLACRWPSPSPSSPVGLAFRLFRNYDGKGGQFGSLVQSASLTGVPAEVLSAFAALDKKRTALTVVLVLEAAVASAAQLTRLPRVRRCWSSIRRPAAFREALRKPSEERPPR